MQVFECLYIGPSAFLIHMQIPNECAYFSCPQTLGNNFVDPTPALPQNSLKISKSARTEAQLGASTIQPPIKAAHLCAHSPQPKPRPCVLHADVRVSSSLWDTSVCLNKGQKFYPPSQLSDPVPSNNWYGAAPWRSKKACSLKGMSEDLTRGISYAEAGGHHLTIQSRPHK